MPVTLTTLDLIQPTGELANSYFPDADLDDHLAGWLVRGEAKVNADAEITAQNDAAAAWVYYLAYTYIANRIRAMPNNVGVGGGEVTRAYGQDRWQGWQQRAEAQKAIYDGLIVPAEATTITPRDSMYVPVQAVW